MFNVAVDDSAEILVQSRTKALRFAVDSSGMNPLEGLYATLAGCAAVYAKKACRELGIPAAGIKISCRPSAGKGGPLTLGRFETDITFPLYFTAEQRQRIVEAVEHCAVKEVLRNGTAIEFTVIER